MVVLIPLAIVGGVTVCAVLLALPLLAEKTVCVGSKAGVPIYARGANMRKLKRDACAR